MLLRVGIHANHRAIESYLFNLLSDVTFYRCGPDGEMHMREFPDNCIQMGTKEVMYQNLDVAIARNPEKVAQFRMYGIPTIYYLSGPPKPGQKENLAPSLVRCQAIVVYSEEHRDLWYDESFPPIVVCKYPIDTEVFSGYTGEIERALMIATMPMNWWPQSGDWKGAWLLRRCLDEGYPFQLIGFNNEVDYPDANPHPIQTESEMVDCLRKHRLYAHTGSFLCRSPLEAAAVGAPVVIRNTEYSHYLEELPHCEGVYRANSVEEFQTAIRIYLKNPEIARMDGAKARACIKQFFSPEIVRAQWMEALETAVGGGN